MFDVKIVNFFSLGHAELENNQNGDGGLDEMDEAWLHIIARLQVEDALRSRRVSSYFDLLCRKSLRSRKQLDIETDCPSCVQDPTAVATVIEHCGANLQNLNLQIRPPNEKYSTIPSSSQVTTIVIKSINTNARKLKRLKIDRMIISLGAIENFGNLPESLEQLQISNCLMNCSEWDVVTVIHKSFEKLLRRCSKLKTFEISGKSMNYGDFHLDPAVLKCLPKSIENVSIAVGSSLKIEDLSFLKGTRLQKLVLQRSFISASSLENLIPMSNTLTHLDLSYSPNLMDCSEISRLTKLQTLNLSSNRDGMEDMALIQIISNCVDLEQLFIDQCNLLTINSLVQLGKIDKLKKLGISGISRVDDVVCMHIAKCSRLEFLDLNFCRKIRKQGLFYLLSSLKSLNHLEVLGILDYSHQLLTKFSSFPKTIVCDSPIQSFSFSLPPLPNLVSA